MLAGALRCTIVASLLLELGLLGYAIPSPGAGPRTPVANADSPTLALTTGPGPQSVPRLRTVPTTPPPLRLLIPSLHINAAVQALGVDSAGVLMTPADIWNVGWYRGGPPPGAAGDAVIDGHVGLPGSPLVFSHLATISLGAHVIAILADGSQRLFSVTSMGVWAADSHPPNLFADGGSARLSLITCTGRYDAQSQTYADRLIVQADYVGPV
ncbi:MAG TPA: class F sortase [Candidatus Nitrosotalea sp.]|nr:class F sortase [Candidatus Nitrosotalea sp.]